MIQHIQHSTPGVEIMRCRKLFHLKALQKCDSTRKSRVESGRKLQVPAMQEVPFQNLYRFNTTPWFVAKSVECASGERGWESFSLSAEAGRSCCSR
jgi:hypothetical protein